MKDLDFAYAVARVRSRENALLSNSAQQQLISARSYDEAVRILNGRGYEIKGTDYGSAIKKETESVWNFMKEILPDIHELDSLVIANDFNDLKVSLKGAFRNMPDVSSMFIYPCVCDPVQTDSLVREKRYDELPQMLGEAAKASWDILVRTGYAQLSDTEVDRFALGAMKKCAAAAFDPFIRQVADMNIAHCVIKVIYRSICAGKSASFMSHAVPQDCAGLDTAELIKAAGSGRDSFFDYLSHTSYAGAGAALRTGTAAFEKYCDDSVMEACQAGKATAFGSAPIAAYYLARQAELKTVRIVLSAKLNGTDTDVIRERARVMYV